MPRKLQIQFPGHHLYHFKLCSQFAPGVFLAMLNGVFKEFASTFEVVQIYLHPGAICAYERNSIGFDQEFDILQTFTITILYKQI